MRLKCIKYLIEFLIEQYDHLCVQSKVEHLPVQAEWLSREASKTDLGGGFREVKSTARNYTNPTRQNLLPEFFSFLIISLNKRSYGSYT